MTQFISVTFVQVFYLCCLQVQKKKMWESVQPLLKTDASGVSMLKEHLMRTSSGLVTSKTLGNANIS